MIIYGNGYVSKSCFSFKAESDGYDFNTQQ